MQLTIRRDQADIKGLLGGHKGVRFKLEARATISDDEKSLIERYRVGDQILCAIELSGSSGGALFVSISKLTSGFSHETEDLGDLLVLESKLKEACVSLKQHLEVMRHFGGEETYTILDES